MLDFQIPAVSKRFNVSRIGKISGLSLSPVSLLALSACGSSSSTTSYDFDGNAVAGPIYGAIAFIDYDEDGELDLTSNGDAVDEPYVYTDSDGAFSLDSTDSDAPVVVTTDSDTAGGLTVSAVDYATDTALDGLTLRAPFGSTVASPMTTIAYDLIEDGYTEAEVATALGLDGIAILSFNPYASGVDATDALAAEKVASQIITLVKGISAAAEGSGANKALAAAAAFKSVVTVTKAAGGTIDLSDATTLASIQVEAVTNVASLVTDTVAFATTMTSAMIGVSAINTAIAALTDFTSSASKGVMATASQLATETKAMAVLEKASAGSGSAAITLTNSTAVASAAAAVASNAAPTDIALSTKYFESGAAGDDLVITITGTDDTTASGDLTYALSGTDATYFTIDSDNGTLTLNASPDYDTKTSYSITITATDGAVIPKSYSETFSITVIADTDAFSLDSLVGTITIDDVSDTVTGTTVSNTLYFGADDGINVELDAAVGYLSAFPDLNVDLSAVAESGGTLNVEVTIMDDVAVDRDYTLDVGERQVVVNFALTYSAADLSFTSAAGSTATVTLTQTDGTELNATVTNSEANTFYIDSDSASISGASLDTLFADFLDGSDYASYFSTGYITAGSYSVISTFDGLTLLDDSGVEIDTVIANFDIYEVSNDAVTLDSFDGTVDGTTYTGTLSGTTLYFGADDGIDVDIDAAADYLDAFPDFSLELAGVPTADDVLSITFVLMDDNSSDFDYVRDDGERQITVSLDLVYDATDLSFASAAGSTATVELITSDDVEISGTATNDSANIFYISEDSASISGAGLDTLFASFLGSDYASYFSTDYLTEGSYSAIAEFTGMSLVDFTGNEIDTIIINFDIA